MLNYTITLFLISQNIAYQIQQAPILVTRTPVCNTSAWATACLPHLRAEVAELHLAAADHMRAALRALDEHVAPGARLPPTLARKRAQLRGRRDRDTVLASMLGLFALRACHGSAGGARNAGGGDARRRPDKNVARCVDAVDALPHGNGVLGLLVLERLAQRGRDELRDEVDGDRLEAAADGEQLLVARGGLDVRCDAFAAVVVIAGRMERFVEAQLSGADGALNPGQCSASGY